MTLQKFHTARPIQKSGFTSNVDIVIPFHGHYDGVAKLIESIFRCTRSNRYQITLVDDCSPNSEFIESLTKVDILQCLRTPEQKGFGGAMQYGFDRTEQPYCIFLNSDVLIEDVGWVRAMGDTLLSLKDKGVRMVVPRTNNAVNGDERQECEKGTKAVEDIILDEGHLSMYCFMCHRQLFSKVGGFIKNYPYGLFEDEEFAHRMKKFGYKQAICGNGWVYHEGQSTIKEVCRRDRNAYKTMIEDNRDRCVEDIKSLYH